MCLFFKYRHTKLWQWEWPLFFFCSSPQSSVGRSVLYLGRIVYLVFSDIYSVLFMLAHINLLCTNICPVGKKSIRQFRELWGSGEYEVVGVRVEIPICCYWPSPQKRRPAVSGSFNSAKPLQVKYFKSPSFHGLSGFFLSFIADSTTTTMCLLQLFHYKDNVLNWDNRYLTHAHFWFLECGSCRWEHRDGRRWGESCQVCL